jgi:hypothetical protein
MARLLKQFLGAKLNQVFLERSGRRVVREQRTVRDGILKRVYSQPESTGCRPGPGFGRTVRDDPPVASGAGPTDMAVRK